MNFAGGHVQCEERPDESKGEFGVALCETKEKVGKVQMFKMTFRWDRRKGLLDSILLDSLHAPKIHYLQRDEEHLRDRWLEKGIGQRLDSI